MKIQSIIQIAIAFFFMFGVFPSIAIVINDYFALPVYDLIHLKIIGLVLAGTGFFIVFHCANVLFFKANQNLPSPTSAPEKFVVAGLYRYVRNPMYIGDFTVILAEFFIFGHLLILGYLVIALFLVNLAVIVKEEKELEKKFGEEYFNYKKSVPRWIPRFNIR